MKILVIAPHADDETLGMGGTIAKFASEGNEVNVAIVTGHGEEMHPIWPKSIWEEIRQESKKALEILNVSDVIYRELPASCLDVLPNWKINEVIFELIREQKPNQIFVPFKHDLHKDHASISYAVDVACRPYLETSKDIKRILAYETLSETHLEQPYMNQSFQPNVFINISQFIESKVSALMAYQSQIQKANMPRSVETIKALAKLRGSTIGCNYAEAFYLIGEYQR